MPRGSVKWFDTEKGFGFIEVRSGTYDGEDIFVHARDVEGAPLRDNDEVEFDVEEDERARNGKMRCARVTGGTGRDDYGRGGGKGSSKGCKPGDWRCPVPGCDVWVFASKDRCFKCGEGRPRDPEVFRGGRGDSRRRGGGGGGRYGGSRSRSRGRGGGGRGRGDSRRRY